MRTHPLLLNPICLIATPWRQVPLTSTTSPSNHLFLKESILVSLQHLHQQLESMVSRITENLLNTSYDLKGLLFRWNSTWQYTRHFWLYEVNNARSINLVLWLGINTIWVFRGEPYLLVNGQMITGELQVCYCQSQMMRTSPHQWRGPVCHGWLYHDRGASPSSHCIANAWSPIQLEIQYVANLCDFSFEMSMRRCFSEGNHPLRNPMACLDQMRTMETWLLKTSLSGKSRSGFLYGATTQTLIYIHLSNNN